MKRTLKLQLEVVMMESKLAWGYLGTASALMV